MRYPTFAVVAALVAAAMTCVGCSQDETMSRKSSGTSMPIGFSAVVNHSIATRSVASITPGTFREFDVWAFRADAGSTNDGYVMGVNATTGYLIKHDSKIGVIDSLRDKYEGYHVWGYASKYQQTYWPSDGTQNLAFYALSPSTVGTAIDNLSVSITKEAPAFIYTSAETAESGSFDGHTTGTFDTNEYTTSHNHQRDIIFAGKRVSLTEINRLGAANQPWMSVPLTFTHALSQIVFDAHLESGCPNLQVDIYSITICNVSRQGTCTINASTGTASWSNLDSKTQSYTVMTPASSSQKYTRLSTTNGTNGNVTTAVDFSSDNLMLIPQAITAWDKTGAPANQYLKIRCNISQNGVNLLTEPYVYAELSAPEGKWEPGKTYTYHLEFGLGRSSSGELNGSEITYTVSIGSNWTTGTTTDPAL